MHTLGTLLSSSGSGSNMIIVCFLLPRAQAFSESDDIAFFDSTVDLLAEQRWTKGRNRGR